MQEAKEMAQKWEERYIESEKEKRGLSEEVKQLRERVSDGGSKGLGLRIRESMGQGKKMVTRKFAIAESFSSVEFIIQESNKHTLYIGDWEHKSLIVVPEAASEPSCTVELSSHPFCAALIMNESLLAVG
jgi:hypothetical protein